MTAYVCTAVAARMFLSEPFSQLLLFYGNCSRQTFKSLVINGQMIVPLDNLLTFYKACLTNIKKAIFLKGDEY